MAPSGTAGIAQLPLPEQKGIVATGLAKRRLTVAMRVKIMTGKAAEPALWSLPNESAG